MKPMMTLDWRTIHHESLDKNKTRNAVLAIFLQEKNRLEELTSSQFFFLNQDVLRSQEEVLELFDWLKQALVPNRKKFTQYSIIKIWGVTSVDLFIPSIVQDVINRHNILTFKQFTDETSTLLSIKKINRLPSHQHNTQA